MAKSVAKEKHEAPLLRESDTWEIFADEATQRSKPAVKLRKCFPWAFLTSLLICYCRFLFLFSFHQTNTHAHVQIIIHSPAFVYYSEQCFIAGSFKLVWRDSFSPAFRFLLPLSSFFFLLLTLKPFLSLHVFPRVIMIMSSLWQCHCNFIKLMSLQFYWMPLPVMLLNCIYRYICAYA